MKQLQRMGKTILSHVKEWWIQVFMLTGGNASGEKTTAGYAYGEETTDHNPFIFFIAHTYVHSTNAIKWCKTALLLIWVSHVKHSPKIL